MLAGEQLAGAAKAGGNFIGDQQHVRCITQRPDLAEVFRGIETHASGSLDNRLQDNRGDLIMMGLDQASEAGDVAVLPVRIIGYGRCIGEELLGKNLREKMMHARIGIADRHGAGRVTVVAAPDRQHLLLARAPLGGPVLDRHLHGNLDTHGPGVTEEHLFERLRGQSDKTCRQFCGRAMSQTAEHDVRHAVEL